MVLTEVLEAGAEQQGSVTQPQSIAMPEKTPELGQIRDAAIAGEAEAAVCDNFASTSNLGVSTGGIYTNKVRPHASLSQSPMDLGCSGNSADAKRVVMLPPPEGERGNVTPDRTRRHRLHTLESATAFAQEIGFPLTVALTITWRVCIEVGDRNHGNILALEDAQRWARLRRDLGRICTKLDIRFAAIWARAIGETSGEHIHIGLHVPLAHLKALVRLLERVTGSEGNPEPKGRDVLGKSWCGGWLIKRINRGINGALGWAGYLARQQVGPIHGDAIGVSRAIGNAAQRNAGFSYAG